MSYCANCGTQYDKPSGLCAQCHFDQHVPEGVIDLELSRTAIIPRGPAFRYPGERAALVLSVAASVILAVVFGVVSFGLFFGVLILSLVQLKVSHVSSQKNMIRASHRSFPTVFRLGKVAAYRLKLALPEIYVTQDPIYNAYTQGFYRYGFIVLNSGLIKDFQPPELLFVIGHEMGHIKRFHTTWLTLLNPARSGGGRFLLAPLMRTIFNVWSVKAEYTADQGGLITCLDVEAASRTLLKLSGGPAVDQEVDLKAMSRAGEEGGVLHGLVEYLGDHPFLQNRVRHAVHYAASPEFQRACWWVRK